MVNGTKAAEALILHTVKLLLDTGFNDYAKLGVLINHGHRRRAFAQQPGPRPDASAAARVDQGPVDSRHQDPLAVAPTLPLPACGKRAVCWKVLACAVLARIRTTTNTSSSARSHRAFTCPRAW